MNDSECFSFQVYVYIYILYILSTPTDYFPNNSMAFHSTAKIAPNNPGSKEMVSSHLIICMYSPMKFKHVDSPVLKKPIRLQVPSSTEWGIIYHLSPLACDSVHSWWKKNHVSTDLVTWRVGLCFFPWSHQTTWWLFVVAPGADTRLNLEEATIWSKAGISVMGFSWSSHGIFGGSNRKISFLIWGLRKNPS